MNRAIGNEEVCSADVQAPKMKGIALIRGAAGAEGIGTKRAISAIRPYISFQDAEHHVAGTVFRLTLAGIPPAHATVRARGPFANAERVAGAVADVGETDCRIEEQNPI